MKQPIGQRRTAQREAILQVILEAQGPLSVQEIHERALERSPSLGIATVYRGVKLLLQDGRIHAVSLPDDQVRYEAADLGHHHHFRCDHCDQVYDLPGCLLPIPNGTSLPGGFEVTGHDITLTGTCPDCQQAED